MTMGFLKFMNRILQVTAKFLSDVVIEIFIFVLDISKLSFEFIL